MLKKNDKNLLETRAGKGSGMFWQVLRQQGAKLWKSFDVLRSTFLAYVKSLLAFLGKPDFQAQGFKIDQYLYFLIVYVGYVTA